MSAERQVIAVTIFGTVDVTLRQSVSGHYSIAVEESLLITMIVAVRLFNGLTRSGGSNLANRIDLPADYCRRRRGRIVARVRITGAT